MLAHISASFWSTPHNIGVGLCQFARAEQSRAEQSRAEQSRAEQSRAEQSRAEQSRAEQSRAEQSRAEQSRAEQSRAEVIQPSSLFARRTVKPTNVPTPSTDVRNDNGILCSKKQYVSPHFLCMLGKCEGKVFLFRNMSLTLLNNEAILYIDDARVRRSSLRGSSKNVPARSSRAQNTQLRTNRT